MVLKPCYRSYRTEIHADQVDGGRRATVRIRRLFTEESARVERVTRRPMLVREPFHRDGWVYEEKVDGWRIVAYKDGDRVRLLSRHGVDHTRRFPGIAAAIAKLSARTLVLDGEVAIYDDQLRSRFEWLREPDRAAVATPPLLMAFDILYRDGHDLTARPLRDRRARLEDAVGGNDLLFSVRRLAANGLEAWAPGGRARPQGLRRQRRGQPLYRRIDEGLAQGQGARLDGSG